MPTYGSVGRSAEAEAIERHVGRARPARNLAPEARRSLEGGIL